MRGQVTGTRVKNLSDGKWYKTVNYYDHKSRLVQTVGDHQKGKATDTNIIDFIGQVTLTSDQYVVNGTTTSVVQATTYDHQGRITTVTHSVNGSPATTLSSNSYNELG